MKVFFNAVFFQLIFNLYIGYRGGQALPKKGPWRKTLYAALVLELFVYLLGTLAFDVLPEGPIVTIMTLTNTWFFASIYLVIGLLALEALRLIDKFSLKIYEGMTQQARARIRLAAFALITLGTAAIIVYGYYIVKHPVIERLSLPIDKPIASKEKKLRIAFFADLHISESINASYVKTVVEKVLAERPDLVLIGGDLIDYHGKFAYRQGIGAMLERLGSETPLGCYQVLGNHEYRADEYKKRKWMRSISHLLVDSLLELRPGITLIGRDDYTNLDRAKLSELAAKVPRGNACILVEHQPRGLDLLDKNGIDLALYGHTHNGQLWPFSILTRMEFELAWGYRQKGKSNIYVTSGVGAAGPAIRAFTRSEILIVDLQFK